ncbi:MAG: ASKHA domain-containing protein [Pseudophaeobacter sp. bin_em_oilr2.035]|uniref:ASKHA domain-containing protein n=1 Tax=Phaeobacter gallaeciensis TaxID=60890 RepID=A0ABD4X5H3_9RHOB|nr:ASKHA domain-containing protein [Phaeobacter gallaeciensis]MDF1771388.1 ASKHA domain-containing protein [Pseudophaeobacter sp. bin_em_oilr2.035]MDE4143682.1 ASKHA domain-containing protein [Phaeobacter gallaeciensis]MDE4155956.1 ASKHA domain-containing protein [Phaeobacter gallaeciensis]MDE4160144.1 ASKHA domain-containing protein [Phaeobacter gallaeciensis]MDE4164762.1 ASKHA domain-containing protein [Phaeobacter gallaeciensis]
MADDPLVVFTPSGKRGRFPAGTPVLTAARQLGVDLDSVCGGRGICSKCQITPSYGEFSKLGVSVQDDALSPWNKVEQRYKDKRGLIDGRRLGCQALIEGDVVIDVPPESQVHRQVVRKRAEARDIVMNPSTRLFYVEVEEPDMHKPSGDLERLAEALRVQWEIENVQCDLQILQTMQPVLRKGGWKVTVAVHLGDSNTPPRIMHIWPGLYEGSLYGLAVDLGSTTIAAHLCDLKTGEVVASSGIMNPQIRFGEDLMSRVSYAMMNKGGDQEMTRAVREGMAQLFTQISAEAGIDQTLIVDAVFVCNPVMHHLFLGIDPFELGQAPFALATSNALSLRASELDLNIHPAARVYLLPCIAGHVGADAAAVALSEAPDKSKDLVLVVDVGTNAEILLGNTEKVLACSSPTGPAFEGAQISSGQRAAPGAIERVEINPETKEPRFRVIGSDLWSDEDGFAGAIATTGITGICGSGIIEAIAEMRLAGVLDASGLIGSAEQTGSSRCIQDGRTNAYVLWDGTADGGPTITVTNPDIRAIQMAKAALYSGARLLMDKFGVDTVDRVVLAGAFGAHISAKHAMVLGMIPDCPLEKVTSAGNAAGTGARIALLNTEARREIEDTVRQIEKVETAVEPRFQEHFVNASAIPNSVEPFPILETVVTLPEVNFNTGGGDGAADGGRRRRRRRG